MTDIHELLSRLESLETQLAFQEDTIESLNQLVTKQNNELKTMSERMRSLGRKLNQLQNNESGPDADPSQEPPPPHY